MDVDPVDEQMFYSEGEVPSDTEFSDQDDRDSEADSEVIICKLTEQEIAQQYQNDPHLQNYVNQLLDECLHKVLEDNNLTITPSKGEGKQSITEVNTNHNRNATVNNMVKSLSDTTLYKPVFNVKGRCDNMGWETFFPAQESIN